MQTIYYTTSNFIHHTDNVVDFTEYRRKLAMAQEGSLAPQPDYDLAFQVEEEPEETPVLREIRPRRSTQRVRRGLWLDVCASLSIVVMTLTFTLHVLML